MIQKQKVVKVGNSLAITLPAKFVQEAGFIPGNTVLVETNAKYKTVYVQPAKTKTKASLTPEFYEWLNEFTEKNKDLLQKLAETPGPQKK